MDTISAAAFKATCLALLDKVERTRQPIRITKRGKPVAQLVPVSPQGKRRLMGCMEGTAKIVGDIESPATPASDWDVLRS
jgi:prevent-host-death family protein